MYANHRHGNRPRHGASTNDVDAAYATATNVKPGTWPVLCVAVEHWSLTANLLHTHDVHESPSSFPTNLISLESHLFVHGWKPSCFLVNLAGACICGPPQCTYYAYHARLRTTHGVGEWAVGRNKKDLLELGGR